MTLLSRLYVAVPPRFGSLQLVGCGAVGARVVVLGRVLVLGRARVRIGDDVILDGRRAPVELNALPGGTIEIGVGARIEGGASLESASHITIGARVVIDGFAKIIDSPFHATIGNRHARQEARPVVVDDDAHIGWRAILLPGAHLARRVTVRPATVVSRAVAEGSTISGVPARVIAGAQR